MALIKKTGLLYEILIRGVHTPGDGAQLGEYQGAHLIEAEAIVDDETGEVVQYKPGVAQELKREQVEKYLGARFVTFDEQMRSARDAVATAQRQLDEAVQESSSLKKQIAVEKV